MPWQAQVHAPLLQACTAWSASRAQWFAWDPSRPAGAQVVVLSAGINDFSEAMINGRLRVVCGPLGKLPPMQEWLGEHEALVREVSST